MRRRLRSSAMVLAGVICILGGAFAEPADQDLLNRILTAPSAPARHAIMAAGRSRLTRGFVGRLIVSAREAPMPRARGMVAVGVEIAAMNRDDGQAAWCHLEGGQMEFHAGHNDRALAAFDRALSIYQRLGDRSGVGNCHRCQGDVFARRGDNAAALALYERAVVFLQEAGDRSGEASCHLGRGAVLAVTGESEGAKAAYDRGLELFKAQGDKRGEASCRLGLASLAASARDDARAHAMFSLALSLFQEVRDRRGEANCYLFEGLLHFWKGDNARALHLFGRALPIFRTLGSKLGEANCYLSQGDVAHTTGDNALALALYGKAAPLFNDIGNKLGEGNCCRSQGEVASLTGDNALASRLYDRALVLYREAGHAEGEAGCYVLQGDLAADSGDHASAMALYARALPLFQAIGDRQGEASCYHSQGLVAYAIGNHARALALFGKALRLFASVDDKLGQAHCHGGTADVALSAGATEEAARLYAAALPLYEAVGDKLGQAHCYQRQGLLASASDPAVALSHYARAISLYQAVGDSAGEGICCEGLADLAYRKGDVPLALQFCTRAAALFRGTDSTWNEAWARYQQGLCLERLGRVAEAMRHVQLSIDMIEGLRQQAGSHGGRSGVLQLFSGVYHAAARLALAGGERERAFELAEAGHGRSVLDLVSGGGLQIYKHMRPVERQLDAKLESDLARANAALSDALGAKPMDAKRVRSAEDARQRARMALDEFEQVLYARHPELAAARGARTLDLKAVAAFLPEDALLLEYVVDPDGVLLFAVSRRGLVAARRLPTQTLAEDVKRFREACARNPDTASIPQRERRSRLSARLYDTLVRPALSEAGTSPAHLIVVPDGPLFELPFHALESEGHFLAERCLVTYAVGASLLESSLDEATRPARPRPRGDVLVVANPDFRGWQGRGIRGGGRGVLSPLPGTQREADALKAIFPNATVLTGDAAQKSVARSQMPHFRYVHFATHGLLDDVNPLYSALALSKPADAAADDGFLYAREIAQMDLAADLVVLSACDTGRGGVRAGDGVLGLLWSCTVAGAPSTVATQWQVDDEATAALMGGFYSALRAGTSRGQALRQAQLELIRDGRHGEPFYWAAFILSGDWR